MLGELYSVLKNFPAKSYEDISKQVEEFQEKGFVFDVVCYKPDVFIVTK